MQVVRFALRNLWRDLKSGELSVLLLALSVAVLSLTAVGFFTSRISPPCFRRFDPFETVNRPLASCDDIGIHLLHQRLRRLGKIIAIRRNRSQ